MSSKTVNEDLLIVTQGSKHVCDTVKPKDECFLIDKKTKASYRNHIATSACANKEATQKTLIRGFRIIHSKSKIGMDHGWIPSLDDNFAGWGGGTKNGQVFFKHANDYPGDHSKNVKVEGNWIVRTDDETQQNKRNCTGKFREGDGGITEAELEALLSKGCTVESVTMTCSHDERSTTTNRLAVLEGDVVTVKMVHVNDAEVEPAERAKPKCQVKRRKSEGKLPADAKEHPYFRVTRSAYPKTSWRGALPALTKDMPGLKIEIGKEWIGEGAKEEKGLLDRFVSSAGEKADTMRVANPKRVEAEGEPNLQAPRMEREQREDDTHIPAQQARAREELAAARQRDAELLEMRRQYVEAENDRRQRSVAVVQEPQGQIEKGREKTQSVIKSGAMLLKSFYALKEVFYARPVEVKIEALACAGAKPVTIMAYPPGSYGINLLELKEFKTAFNAIRDAIAKVRAFLKKVDGAAAKEEGAGAEVAIETGQFTISIWILKDAAAELAVEFRELTRDSGAGEATGRKKHEVHRAFTLDLKLDRLVGIRFSHSIPLAFAAGCFGVLAQKLLKKVGADLSVEYEIDLSIGVSGRIEYDEYGKMNWARKASITPKVKFTLSLNATAGGFTMKFGVSAEWAPTVELEPANDQPFCVKRLASSVDIKWFVEAAIDILGWTVDFEYSDTIWSGKLPEAKYALA